MEKTEIVPEIVIIKRKRGGEEGHHGGVWKIAYADFMTAMMAFFLVMWLINAANEATRSQVASYFNPVKLTDNTARRRGLNNEESKQPKINSKTRKNPADKVDPVDKKDKGGATKKDGKKKASSKTDREGELFKNPIKSLDAIAGGKVETKSILDLELPKSEAIVREKVVDQQDPFSPKNWQILDVDAFENARAKSKPKIKRGQKKAALERRKPIKTTETVKKDVSPKGSSEDKKNKLSIATTKQKSGDAKAKQKNIEKTTPVSPAKDQVKDDRLAKLRSAINAARKWEVAGAGPKVTVSKTKEGILLSLTDGAEFGMFKIASAKPAKELVLYMEKIAKILKGQQGKLVVRGHTDGRPFHSDNYDNWRLSTARAQMARFMLMRGGTLPDRFVRVEGYADRQLKIKDDPLDPKNRRIEILVLDQDK